ncbi:MAG: hypothetical protein KC505_08075, partial [Myxococcales bacterium]|nr:hypothetical protein [Myxococcales bacterium]
QDATLKYFEQGKEALSYIHQLKDEQKNKTILLADYELLHQELDGLDVISQAAVENAILVTSRFSNRDLQNELNELNVKMLPKLYISEVPINVVS